MEREKAAKRDQMLARLRNQARLEDARIEAAKIAGAALELAARKSHAGKFFDNVTQAALLPSANVPAQAQSQQVPETEPESHLFSIATITQAKLKGYGKQN